MKGRIMSELQDALREVEQVLITVADDKIFPDFNGKPRCQLCGWMLDEKMCSDDCCSFRPEFGTQEYEEIEYNRSPYERYQMVKKALEKIQAIRKAV